MRKILGLALVATLLMSVSVFAASRLTIAPNASFATGGPATTNNNDSCDIGVTPAATLLLPYFEVETAARSTTTLFTITNTSRFPQIAHVTLWTDWSAPVLDFNIFLTGYDVQGINLYDVIVSGIIAPGTGAGGTSVTTAIGTAASSVTIGSSTPASNTSNPNFVGGAGSGSNCTNLIGTLPPSVATAVLQALTTGSASNLCGGDPIGNNHGTRAIGYVTVDVSAACSVYLPTDRLYYGSADGILYDNTLIGDYQQIGPSPSGSAGTGFDAGGNTMVHIRAIPEGGTGTSAGVSNLPFTFYSRYSGNTDRRQPLPSTWAARFIQGGASGLATNYKIWREGVTGNTACAVTPNSALPVTNVIRFDEHENSVGFGGGQICSPCPGGPLPTFPETSSNSTSSGSFPTMVGADVGGWMYLNLSNGNVSSASGFTPPGALSTASRAGLPGAFCAAGAGCTSPLVGSVPGSRTTSQNWVVISMFGNVNASRLSVDFDAAWLGNGCTPAPDASAEVGPQPFGSPTGALICSPTVAPCGVGTVVPVPNP
jgi:hypothetical protein